ncbi:hypothetical protein [Shimia sp. NS0008-38b]
MPQLIASAWVACVGPYLHVDPRAVANVPDLVGVVFHHSPKLS